MHIRRQITISMLLTAMLPLAISIGLALWHGTNQTKKLTLETAQGRLDTAAEKLSLFFSKRIAEVSTYSQTSAMKSMKFPEIRPFLMSELSRHENIYEKFILGTPEGYFYNTSGGNPDAGGLRTFNDRDPNAKPKHIRKRDYWQQTVGKNNHAEMVSYVSDPMISYTTGAKQVVVASTILSGAGEVTGMIGGALPWPDIQRRIESVNEEILGKLNWDAKFFMVSHTGTYWYHWDPKHIVQLIKDEQGKPVLNEIGENVIVKNNIMNEKVSEIAEAGKRMIKGESGYTSYKDPESSDTYYMVFSHIPSANYSIGLVVPEQEIMSPVTNLQNIFVYIFLAAAVFVVVTAYFISHRVSSPIVSLNKMTKEISQGNWSAVLEPTGNTETRELTKSFIAMADSIKNREYSLLLSEQKLEKVNSELEQRITERTKDLESMNTELENQVNEKIAAEYALRSSEDLLQSTGHLAHIGGWKLDVLNGALTWTEETYHIYGLPLDEEPTIEAAARGLAADSKSVFMEAVNNAKAYGTPFDIEVVHVSGNGSKKWLRIICRIYKHENKVMELVGACQDVSELKKVEKIKNEFISAVSHELRTPLTSISGSLSLLKSGEITTVDDKAMELLDIASRNSERLLLLINDLLDMERLELDKMTFSNSCFSLLDLLKQAIDENEFYGKKYDVTYNISGDILDVNINVDHERFLQVMSNLLSNAAKFTVSKTSVDIFTDKIADNMVRVSVRDYGEGIPEEFQSDIFKKFSQADSSVTRKLGGTGLGLSISKSIIEHMGGTISFHSVAGEGATFYFDLPIVN